MQSSYPLPLHKAGSGSTPDVTIRKQTIQTPAGFPDEEARRSVIRQDGCVLMAWPEVGIFRVQADHIVVDPIPSVDGDLISAFLAGAGLGVLLHLRGFLTLHASAVGLEGVAIALMGPKMMGKSTTASAFCAHGASLVTDDVLVVDPSTLAVHPGGRFCKLGPNAAEAIATQSAKQLPLVYEQTRKRYWEPGSAHTAELQLARVYLLDYTEGDQLEIEPVSKRGATIALIRDAYALRFLGEHTDGGAHLQACARIARRIPVYRLRRVPGLEHLSDIVRAVKNDLR